MLDPHTDVTRPRRADAASPHRSVAPAASTPVDPAAALGATPGPRATPRPGAARGTQCAPGDPHRVGAAGVASIDPLWVALLGHLTQTDRGDRSRAA